MPYSCSDSLYQASLPTLLFTWKYLHTTRMKGKLTVHTVVHLRSCLKRSASQHWTSRHLVPTPLPSRTSGTFWYHLPLTQGHFIHTVHNSLVDTISFWHGLQLNRCILQYMYMFVQSSNMHNLESALHIFRIWKLRANLKIAQYVCTISTLQKRNSWT